MTNPFLMEMPDGARSRHFTRTLKLLLESNGSPVPVVGFALDQHTKWLAHAVPVFSTEFLVDGEWLPVQLDWNTFRTPLVLTIGAIGDQVRYILSQQSLLEAVAREKRLTRERQAALEIVFAVRAEQVSEFRELVASWNAVEDDGGDELGDRLSAFYDEHPDLAPDHGRSVMLQQAV